MLVYGDPQFRQSFNSFRTELENLLGRTGPEDLDELRTLLIRAGQFEQGVADAVPPGPGQQGLNRVIQATDRIADLFVAQWARCAGLGAHFPCDLRVLHEAEALLEGARLDGDPPLCIKVPEGFAFYALYPEQYCVSALRWTAARESVPAKQALVVGIRSIGTTLSAVVRAVISHRGWRCTRTTVRPSGHPFFRQAALDAYEPCPGFAPSAGIVVDEGPGISGSSMAAAAQALASAGINDISFLPGHEKPPGPGASLEVRKVWSHTEKYVTSLDELRWNGLSLKASMVEQSRRLASCLEAPGPGARTLPNRSPIEDLGGGLWRKHAFASENEWPAVATTMERVKFLCSTGDERQVLWKFGGLGCATAPHELVAGIPDRDPSPGRRIPGALHRANRLPERLGSCLGFIAMPWIHGRRLCRMNGRNPTVMDRLGSYIVQAAGPVLEAGEAREAVERLAQMLDCNTREALGSDFADQCRPLSQAALDRHEGGFSYGDGRQAPWEWVQTPSNELVKTDCFGHQVDHTLVGRQSVLWDVAGAIVEWDLSAPQFAALLARVYRGSPVPGLAIFSFYLLAYAAFRLGFCTLFSAQEPSDSPECVRLEGAGAFYRKKLTEFAALRRL